ncbi:XAC2610-related protein [Pedobacter fastidiosus]|uniref:VCBS repeat-containing protein n=1 Tax=Pedobacter fastidiosus TaxID=2765361 RepID=A0ABR7KQ65_9SPHI|nr:hypothetical protein [Pedobacter fastidiosus]MBC6110226.1 hypothetical protein [Pedobacter fastidiosus]
MKNFLFIFILIGIFFCRTNAQRKESTPTKGAISNRKQFKGKFVNQSDTECVLQKYHPFTDKNYVVTIKNCPVADVTPGDNATISFSKGQTVFLKDSLFIKIQNDFLEFKDFNGDGVKDILIFSETGGRGGNSFYYLYLVDPKNKKIARVKDFENVVNPEYDKKHNVIVAYGLSGTNNYSIYKISGANKAYQIGKSFEDDFESDADVLNKKIIKILKAGKR